MDCGFCRRRLGKKSLKAHGRGFHPECLGKIKATAEGFGKFLHAFQSWDKGGRTGGGMDGLTQAFVDMAPSFGEYLKQLAENARKGKNGGPSCPSAR